MPIDWTDPEAVRAYHHAYRLRHADELRLYHRMRRILRSYVPEFVEYDRQYDAQYHRDRYRDDPEFRARKDAAAALYRARHRMGRLIPKT